MHSYLLMVLVNPSVFFSSSFSCSGSILGLRIRVGKCRLKLYILQCSAQMTLHEFEPHQYWLTHKLYKVVTLSRPGKCYCD